MFTPFKSESQEDPEYVKITIIQLAIELADLKYCQFAQKEKTYTKTKISIHIYMKINYDKVVVFQVKIRKIVYVVNSMVLIT